MKLVVSVVYQEKTSAFMMSGMKRMESAIASRAFTPRAYSRRKIVHCATSDSSATVATARLMTAAEIHES